MSDWEKKVALVKKHYQEKGFRVHSGLQFGSELVLYADRPELVHSDFCIHVVRDDELIDWREMQSLVRSMPDLHKTLILANARQTNVGARASGEDDELNGVGKGDDYTIEEIALATEHAPFRHRPITGEVGSQKKPKKGRSNKKQKTAIAADND